MYATKEDNSRDTDQSISFESNCTSQFCCLEPHHRRGRWMDNDCLRVSLAVYVSWMCDASQRPGENVAEASLLVLYLSRGSLSQAGETARLAGKNRVRIV